MGTIACVTSSDDVAVAKNLHMVAGVTPETANCRAVALLELFRFVAVLLLRWREGTRCCRASSESPRINGLAGGLVVVSGPTVTVNDCVTGVSVPSLAVTVTVTVPAAPTGAEVAAHLPERW